jgi:hypothetical protein
MGGRAYVTWYDRRTALANNDLTGFWAGSAAVRNGALEAGPEIDVSGVSDPQCASGWPEAPRVIADSESCSMQPQLAGICCDKNGCDGTRCDFSTGTCTAGMKCTTGDGLPKYGDYNGTACIAGKLYAVWTSATTPSGLLTGLRIFESTIPMP